MLTGKKQVAMLSVGSNALLIILKAVAGILSGSVSILSEAIHSGMDLAASCIAFFSVSYSSRPADKGHPYGHGKIENISGVVEGILIFIAAGLIIYEAVQRIVYPVPLEETSIAMWVMFVSAAANTVVSSILYKVAKKEDSIALQADALHLKTDVYTSAGVGIGILLIKLTNLYILDPIVAILVALLIIRESFNLCAEAFRPLLDAKLPDSEEKLILNVLESYSGKIVDYHELKTRKSGTQRYADLHIMVDPAMSVEESHEICNCIEEEVQKHIPNVNLTIHIEPSSLRK